MPADPAEVLAVIQRVGDKFPEVETWDHVFQVLWRTTKDFNRSKGNYQRFLATSLRRRLYEAALRQRRASRGAGCGELDDVEPPRPDEVAHAHLRWARRLLDLALARLPVQAQEFFAYRREDAPVREIAAALGVSQKTLSNKYGRDKLEALIRGAAVALVRELLPVRLAVLVRHLREEAGLSTPQVERLLGVSVGGVLHAPLLEEGAVLAFLGWQ